MIFFRDVNLDIVVVVVGLVQRSELERLGEVNNNSTSYNILWFKRIHRKTSSKGEKSRLTDTI